MNQRPAPELWGKLRPVAAEMRKHPTKAEAMLWAALRAGRGGKAKFRRQHAIGQYIVDFYCRAANLVIEVDGSIHDSQRDADAERQALLESYGLNVLRLTNDEVIRKFNSTLHTIRQITEGAVGSPPRLSGVDGGSQEG